VKTDAKWYIPVAAKGLKVMNKRVTIEMPDEMLKLVEEYAAKKGAAPDAYMLDVLGDHLEDLHDIELAEAAMARIRSGEDQVISSEEFWRGLDD
jgi:RHH-type rel operon transcriptional repressor/antitoxin RelB